MDLLSAPTNIAQTAGGLLDNTNDLLGGSNDLLGG